MGASHFLPSIVGPQVAAQMMLIGELISGSQAADRGLVAEAVPPAAAAASEGESEGGEDECAVLAAAMSMATRMAGAGPVAVRTCVRVNVTDTRSE